MLTTARSLVNGTGIFTTTPIQKNKKIFTIRGIILSLPDFFRASKKVRDNTYRLRVDAYLSPGDTAGNWLNHSCAPNSRIVKENGKLSIVALRRIPKDREILFDYSTVLAKDDFWVMRCRCGTKSCRGVVKNYTFLPPKVLKRYIKQDILPLYIQKIPADEGTD